MLTIIFVFLFFIIIVLLEQFDIYMNEFFSLLFFVIYVCVSVYGIWSLNFKYCQVLETERIDLYAGYNSNEISGSFFLLAGSISDEDTVYYWINENGFKTKHEVSMKNSAFIEDGGEYLIKNKYVCQDNINWLFIMPLADPDYKYEFHVPEGSILTMYGYR